MLLASLEHEPNNHGFFAVVVLNLVNRKRMTGFARAAWPVILDVRIYKRVLVDMI